MAESCRQCPALRAENAHLQQTVTQQRHHIARLERHIGYLRDLLMRTLGAVRGTVAFINIELERPTIPRRQLIPAIHQRLTTLLDQAEGTQV